MVTSPSDETRIGPPAIRFLLESEASAGSVAVLEFDVRPERTCRSVGGDPRGHE
jgi:hypothetical protein